MKSIGLDDSVKERFDARYRQWQAKINVDKSRSDFVATLLDKWDEK